MRFFFGIAGLLIVIGIIVWIMGTSELPHTQEVLKQKKSAEEQVSQIAGLDNETRKPAIDSVDLDVLTSNRKPTSILVTKVVPGGAFDRYFGVQKNDTITAVEVQGATLRIRDLDDAEMAKAQISDAFARQGSLIVKRDGQELKLPQQKAQAAVVAAPPPPTPAAQPPAPAAAENTGTTSTPVDRRSPLQRQLDTVTAPR